jgi:HlyD family secretion protein
MFDILVADFDKQTLDSGQEVALPTGVDSARTAITSHINAVNGSVTSLASAVRTISDAQNTIADAHIGDPLDLATQQNTVRQREADLQSARTTLADHTVRAPFGGVVAKVNSKKGDTVGSGTAIATVISHSTLATVPLNEVDVAKVKLGQKATLTFDAVPDLTMTGTVAQVDSIGTTSQGVVSYTVTIALDTQDAQVRPGMSASVTILLETHQDVLVVPASAVKSQNGSSYVEVLTGATTPGTVTGAVTSAAAPSRVTVTTGISDDTSTEILTGLTEGQEVIVRTITGTTAASAGSTSTRSNGIIPGGGGGATFRALGR